MPPTDPIHIADDAQTIRVVDDALTIREVLAEPGVGFDIARATLVGHHPMVVNHVSERAYYFLKGKARMRVGSQEFDVSPGDAVYIPCDVPHGLDGDAQYLIVTSPAFAPENEEIVG